MQNLSTSTKKIVDFEPSFLNQLLKNLSTQNELAWQAGHGFDISVLRKFFVDVHKMWIKISPYLLICLFMTGMTALYFWFKLNPVFYI